jgi:hypothetical protein
MAGKGEHLWIQVQPVVGDVASQVGYVAAGAAGAIEQCVSVRALVLGNELLYGSSFLGVILPAVDGVVLALGLGEHRHGPHLRYQTCRLKTPPLQGWG